ncbi:hypothetical protein BC831DRAFT_463625 [Entophlyctis helioformis]|nr:hypothetical protein BC831DRAFT_463625 [Entophlyctis helioformis]
MLFVGLDLSTQQLKLTAVRVDAGDSDVLAQTHHAAWSCAVAFDMDLPRYGTTNGAISDGARAVHTPTLLWVDALDLLLGRLQDQGFPFHEVRAIAGCAQQHGSVYWSANARSILRSLRSSEPLASQLRDKNAFSVPMSPIWQDTSTRIQCDRLEAAVGGPDALAAITGSRAFERFTGPQIAKVHDTAPEAYANTAHISLVSSFLASLLVGDLAPIDVSDGSGMNLLNLHTRDWDERLLDACAPDLRRRLGPAPPVLPTTSLGCISPYFVARYAFSPDCIVCPFTGDNPGTICSLPLRPDDLLVSLGTSDTLCYTTDTPTPTRSGHVFCHPFWNTQYVGMLVFQNGSLTREWVKDTYADGQWSLFERHALDDTQGRQDVVGCYYLAPEITPSHPGGRVYRLQDGCDVKEFDPPSLNCRAVVESQMLRRPWTRILATGGAAANPAILQIMADVFGLPVYTMRDNGVNSASFGGALMALHVYGRSAGHAGEYDGLPDRYNGQLHLAASPRHDRQHASVGTLASMYARFGIAQ